MDDFPQFNLDMMNFDIYDPDVLIDAAPHVDKLRMADIQRTIELYKDQTDARVLVDILATLTACSIGHSPVPFLMMSNAKFSEAWFTALTVAYLVGRAGGAAIDSE